MVANPDFVVFADAEAKYNNLVIKRYSVENATDKQHGFYLGHYKTGTTRFEKWIREATAHDLHMSVNYFVNLATRLLEKGGVLPEDDRYGLEKWLLGRQWCYAFHVVKGRSDRLDGHYRPIEVARKLIRMLAPAEAEKIITSCTPLGMEITEDATGEMTFMTITVNGQTISDDVAKRKAEKDEREKKEKLATTTPRSQMTTPNADFDLPRRQWRGQEDTQRRPSSSLYSSSSSTPYSTTSWRGAGSRNSSTSSTYPSPPYRKSDNWRARSPPRWSNQHAQSWRERSPQNSTFKLSPAATEFTPCGRASLAPDTRQSYITRYRY